MAWGTALAVGSTLFAAGMSARNQKKAGDAQGQAAILSGEAERRMGLAQQDVAESQAELAEFNAAVAELQAKDAITRGDQEANRFRQRLKVFTGEQRAGIATGNVDVGYGSAVDVQADTALTGELDALTITTNATREAWGYRVEATDLRERARIARKEGTNAALAGELAAQTGQATAGGLRSAGKWGAATTLVGAGASLLMAKYGFR